MHVPGAVQAPGQTPRMLEYYRDFSERLRMLPASLECEWEFKVIGP